MEFNTKNLLTKWTIYFKEKKYMNEIITVWRAFNERTNRETLISWKKYKSFNNEINL